MSPNDQCKDKDFVSISTQTDITVRKSFQGIQQVQCASPPVRSKVQKKNSGSKEHEDVLERRLNPRTQKDFESLFQEVEQWRDFKLRDIESSENVSSERRKEERAIILSKETKLLIKIDCLKKKVMKENLKRKLTEGLNGLSGDEVWEMSTGERIIIETPTRKYASKLADIYQQLSLYDIHDGKPSDESTKGRSFSSFLLIYRLCRLKEIGGFKGGESHVRNHFSNHRQQGYHRID